MAVPIPLLTEFAVHYNLESCECVAMKGTEQCMSNENQYF